MREIRSDFNVMMYKGFCWVKININKEIYSLFLHDKKLGFLHLWEVSNHINIIFIIFLSLYIIFDFLDNFLVSSFLFNLRYICWWKEKEYLGNIKLQDILFFIQNIF